MTQRLQRLRLRGLSAWARISEAAGYGPTISFGCVRFRAGFVRFRNSRAFASELQPNDCRS